MENFLPISKGINVIPLLLGLRRNPQLWNRHTARTEDPTSPHREVDDIWARYAGNEYTTQAHDSIWMPAADLIPEIKLHARAIMGLVNGDSLGGVLITRIPPGKQVYPHTDMGWHATTYDKFALQLAAHPQQAFCYKEDGHITATGDLYWFHNQAEHWVINNSPVERITMIVCVRMDKPFGGL